MNEEIEEIGITNAVIKKNSGCSKNQWNMNPNFK